MKIFKTILFLVTGFCLIAVGYNLRHRINEGFWPGLAGLLIGLGLILLVTAIAAQIARMPGRSQPVEAGGDKVATLLAAYPGPVTLKASRTGWMLMWTSIVCIVGSIALGIWAFPNIDMSAGTLAGSAFEIGLYGLWAGAYSACLFLRGALRLDRNGFQATFLLRRQYLWSEVDDFRIKYNNVEFDVVKPGEWHSPWDGRLADNYGLQAGELADLLESWQSAALGHQQSGVP